jgi:hypothetical protein
MLPRKAFIAVSVADRIKLSIATRSCGGFAFVPGIGKNLTIRAGHSRPASITT